MVRRGFDWQLHKAAKREQRRIHRLVALLVVVVPSQRQLRELQKCHEHSNVFGWKLPLATRNQDRSQHTLQVERERLVIEKSARHLLCGRQEKQMIIPVVRLLPRAMEIA